MTIEIPSKNWSLFCDRITELPQEAVSIGLTEPGGRNRPVVDDVPLLNMVFQKQNDACNDVLTIATGLPNERPLQHEVLEPIRIVLWRSPDRTRFNRLEILAENGTTEVHFRPGIITELLEPLAH